MQAVNIIFINQWNENMQMRWKIYTAKCIYLKAVPLKIKVSYHIIQQFYLWEYTQELKGLK